MDALARNSIVMIPFPSALYRRVIERYPDTPSTLIKDVVSDFLDRTEDDRAERFERAGVDWSGLFLENGTLLRTKYLGTFVMIEVRDRRVWWNGRVFESVSKAVNAARGDTSNNAWKVCEIKRPRDSGFVQAEVLRHGRRP